MEQDKLTNKYGVLMRNFGRNKANCGFPFVCSSLDSTANTAKNEMFACDSSLRCGIPLQSFSR